MAKYTKKQRKNLKTKSGKKNKTGKRLNRNGKKLIRGGGMTLDELKAQLNEQLETGIIIKDKNRNMRQVINIDPEEDIVSINISDFEINGETQTTNSIKMNDLLEGINSGKNFLELRKNTIEEAIENKKIPGLNRQNGIIEKNDEHLYVPDKPQPLIRQYKNIQENNFTPDE